MKKLIIIKKSGLVYIYINYHQKFYLKIEIII